MKKSTLIIVGIITILALILGLFWWQGRDSSSTESGDEPLLITRRAERRTLRTEQTLRGVLERVEAKTVNSPLQGRASEVAISDGDLVNDGDVIMSIDGRPVVAVTGDLEFFRTLDVGSRGPDVEELERVLVRAGFDPGPVDNLYTNETRSALGLWQATNGYPGSTPESGETITLSLQGSGAYSVGAQNTASITIDPLLASGGTFSGAPGASAIGPFAGMRQALPALSLVSNTPTVAEGRTAEFQILSDPAPTADLTIPITIGGTARGGSDYTMVTSVTVRSGATSTNFSIDVLQDSEIENIETINVSLAPGVGYTLGDSSVATATIQDDESRPQLQISGTGSVAEGATATLTVNANQASANDLTVTLSIGGTATPGNNSDYVSIGGAFTLPAGQTSLTIPVTTLSDDLIESTETIVIRVEPRPGYSVGSLDTATVSVTDASVSVTPSVSIIAAAQAVGEGAPTSFTVVSSAPSTRPVDVQLVFSGSAVDGVDFHKPKESRVTIAPNTTAITFTVTTIASSSVQPDRVLLVSVGSGPGYAVGVPNSATTTIEDTDIPEVTISGGGNVSEGGAQLVTIAVDQAPRFPLDVQFDVTGAAQPDLDYDRLPLSATIPAGAVATSVVITTLHDSTIEFDEDVVISLRPSANPNASSGNYVVGNNARASVTIVDAHASSGPILTISSSAATVPEGGTVVFTVNASNPSDRPIDVNLNLAGNAVLNSDYTFPTGVITIQPGQSQTQIQVQTRQDDGIEGDKSIEVTLAPGSGYSVGKPATASARISSEDVPELTLRGGNIVLAEGDSVAFIIEADQAPTQDTSVNYSFGSSSATPGVDFEILTGTVVLRAGQRSVTIPVFTVADDVRFEPADMLVAQWPARVGDIAVDAGQTISPGQPLVRITEDTFSVTWRTDANTLSDLFVGMTVELEVAAAGDLETLGQIVEIDDTATIDANGAEVYEGRIELSEEVAAAEGANVTITIITEEAADVVVVPIAAVLQGPDGDEVRVINLDSGDLERRVVVTGLDEDSFIEIVSGIDVGDLIVVDVES